jgi:L-amino acid N-acyltransferase
VTGKTGPVTHDGVKIRDATAHDVRAITDLYNQYVTTRTIEWTERAHTLDGRRAWLAAKHSSGWPVLVATVETTASTATGTAGSMASDRVVGMATYGDFRDSIAREGYRFTVEHSVHVAEDMQGRGVGRSLMEALVERARAAGLHVMIGAVDGENPASIRFHEQLGFVEVGRLPEIGQKFGRWLDLVLVQKML